MNEQVNTFFKSLQRKPNVVSGHVTAVTADTTTGAQRQATVTIGGNTIGVPLDALAPRLALGDQVRLEQFGQAALAEYRLAGLEAGARPGAGLYPVLDNGTGLGGATYLGGDVIFGKLAGGNIFVEYATGRLYHRIALEVNGIEYPDGSQLFGHAALTGGDYAADGANVFIDPTGGVKIRSATTDVLTADATNGIRQYTNNVQRTWIKNDGSGWFVGSDKFSWDTSGNISLAGAITAGTIDIGGADATSFHVDAAGNIWSGAALYASGVFKVSSAGALVSTSATITGTINATAGYFGDASTRVAIEAAGINVGNTGSIRGGRTAWDTGTGFWLGYYNSAYRFAIGVPAGREMVFDGVNLTLNGALVTSLYQGSEPAIFGWQCTCVFTATDADTVAWSAGSFILSDGTTYSINAGNTGNMSARNYIYLDKAVSTTALQKTTTAATAVGSGKVLIATAINSTTEALWQVFSGTGGVQIGGGQIEQRSITASEIATGTLTANEIAANTITAGLIAAGTITTTQIAANTIVAGNIAASTITGDRLAASTITAGLLSVTAGGANLLLNSTFQVDTDANGTADVWGEYNPSVGTEPGTLAIVASGGVDNRAFQRVTWAATNTTTKGVATNTGISGGVQGAWLASTTYIVSFYAKTSYMTGGAAPVMALFWTTAPASVTAISNPALAVTWQRYIFRVTWGASVEGFAGLYIGIATAAAVIGNVEFDHVQVEQADTPSAWKPFASELEPGSVTADKISVTSLAAIEVDTGALNMSGALTIGSSGGIYQGTGTFASPTTGLKVWNDGDIGRIAGYNATAPQWYAGTDGKLYAGAGKAWLDAGGMNVLAAVDSYALASAYSIMGDASTEMSALYGFIASDSDTYTAIRGSVWSGADVQTLEIKQSAAATKTAVLKLNAETAAASVPPVIQLTVDASGASDISYTAEEHVFAGGPVDATYVYKVDGVQVVGNRVIDARCDDTVNTSTWDSTTAGVLDALRDAMITHGLIAAA